MTVFSCKNRRQQTFSKKRKYDILVKIPVKNAEKSTITEEDSCNSESVKTV